VSTLPPYRLKEMRVTLALVPCSAPVVLVNFFVFFIFSKSVLSTRHYPPSPYVQRMV